MRMLRHDTCAHSTWRGVPSQPRACSGSLAYSLSPTTHPTPCSAGWSSACRGLWSDARSRARTYARQPVLRDTPRCAATRRDAHLVFLNSMNAPDACMTNGEIASASANIGPTHDHKSPRSKSSCSHPVTRASQAGMSEGVAWRDAATSQQRLATWRTPILVWAEQVLEGLAEQRLEIVDLHVDMLRMPRRGACMKRCACGAGAPSRRTWAIVSWGGLRHPSRRERGA